MDFYEIINAILTVVTNNENVRLIVEYLRLIAASRTLIKPRNKKNAFDRKKKSKAKPKDNSKSKST